MMIRAWIGSQLNKTLLLSFFLLFALTNNSVADTALWVAESEGVLKIATTDGEILFEIADENGVELVAVNRTSNQIWTYGNRRLKAYSANGVLELDRQAPNNLQQYKAVDMAVDQSGVWLAAHKTLYRFDLQGRLQHHVRFRQAIQSIALDTTRSQLWVAVSHKVFILDQQLNDINHFRTFFPFIPQLAYDEQLDSSWMVSGPYLLRLSNNNLDVEFLSRFGTGRWLWQHLSPDGDGGVWGSTQTTVSHVDDEGWPDVQFKPFHSQGKGQAHGVGHKITDLVANPEDQSVWIAGRKILKHYNRVGAQQIELMPDLGDGIIRKINRIDLASDAGSAPVINIVQPITGSFINDNTPLIELAFTGDGTIDTDSIEITLNDNALNLDCTADQQTASCTVLNALADGEITLQASIADLQGNRSESAEVAFTIDTIAPVVTINSPSDGLITNIPVLTISGQVSEAIQTLTLNHNGNLNSLSPANTAFETDVMLSEGSNTLSLTAVDYAGNSSTATFSVVLDTLIPAIPDMGAVTVSRPDGNGQATVTGNAGSVEPNSRVTITNTRTGESIIVTADADGRFTAQIAAEVGDTVQISVTDAAGNSSEPAQTVVTDLPPDPATVAPPLNPTQITPLLDATAFLYTGSNPIQTGVAPETIEARRVAVIRGAVLDKQNNPLPGVTITVKDHPEYGQTLSRTDGMFDLAVNGGGVLTLNYAKEDYLPVQRNVNTPWQDYVFADDIVMIGLDPQVTTIDLTNPTMQVAQGTPQTDSDGTRQATILFPSGTTASMTLPDGTQQALTTLTVRATEYTVGENGPDAMPGKLPPTSAYTYAVELSIDEAIAVNATRVDFNQPIPFYVDNFLNFPTGEVVPIGYYDRERAVWVPSDNGRVIEILTIENNQAVLDVNGEGTAATQNELDELVISVGELEGLATRYQPGTSFWRSPITHFTPWDCNWPYGPPEDAVPPPAEEPETEDKDQPDTNDQNECDGCVISPQAQTVGEEIPITGTPYSLHYRSDRVPGRKSNRISIGVSGSSVPASLRRIKLSLRIAGRGFSQTFAPAPNQRYNFEWDGLDGFGRQVYGSVVANITLSYEYPCIYRPGDNGFGRFSSSTQAIGTRENCRGFVFAHDMKVTLQSPLNPPVNVVGNWSLNIQHAWDAVQSRHIQGDGGYRTVLGTIDTAVGNGQSGYSGDGGPATDAMFDQPNDVATDAMGNLYIVDSDNHRIRRVDVNGVVTSLNDGFGFFEEDGPALETGLNSPYGVAVDAQGNLYIAERERHRVRRISRDGFMTTVAGTGTSGYSGDGGPATEARLFAPEGVAVDAAGNLYIADTLNNRIRKVSPDGFITKFAGAEPTGFIGNQGFSGDGGPATLAGLYNPSGVAVDTEGNLYIADTINNRIRRVGSDGVITTVAGSNRETGFSGDGGLATLAQLNRPRGVTVDAVGNLYIADTNNSRIRRVDRNGIIGTLAGNGNLGFSGDGGLAVQATFNRPGGVAVDAVGNLYVADSSNNRIRRISAHGAFALEPAIASEDSSQQFVFDRGGRHLRTLNTFTGETVYEFGRDSEGRLITITDIDGDITTIERDTNGVATAMVAPDGQRTKLDIDANGHLTVVTNPANEEYRMTYTPDGLMETFRDRKNQLNTFGYDALGRLISDVNAGGGGWILDRAELSEGYQTTLTTAEGRELNFTVEPQTNNDRIQVNTGADGSVQQKRFRTNGQEVTTQPDGTLITVQEGPDPRFGMQSPVPSSVTVRAPSGLTSTTTTTRAATLVNPADLLSLQTLDETTTINGRVFQSVYDATTRTYTRTSAQGRTATQIINAQGRPVSSQISGLAPIGFGYDARGRLDTIAEGTGAEQRLTGLTYFASGLQAGHLQSITDSENRTASFEYDAAGRVTRQVLPDSREIVYGYDANGNLTSITPPGRPAHVFNYNAFDLEGQYTPPTVSGITTPQTTYDYNLDKELIRITRPDDQEINFNYNSGAQLTSMVLPTGTYSYTYLSTSGQLDTITSPDNIVLDYSYDGFLLTGQSWTGAISGSVTQTYNNNFFITQRCVNANCINAGYDNDGLLTSAGALTLTRDPQRAGLITNTTLSNVTTANTYNGFGELESFEAQYSTTQYFNTVFVRDDLGRIETKTETVQGAAVTDVYTYDLAGRLDTVTRNGQLIDYAYDNNGNRLSRTEGANVESGVYDNQDRLTSYNGCTYSYTDNGELTQKTCGTDITTYKYDVLGNLLAVTLPDTTEIEYIIDGQNRRVGKRVNGTLAHGFLYQDQLNPIAELNPDGSIRSRFVYGEKMNVPAYMIRDGVTYRIISDHLGSPRLVINTNDGTIAQRIDYDEFGRVLNDSDPGFQPFGFAGGIYDADTGLVRFGARDYDSTTSRWTTKDPIKFDGGLNHYNYAINDPVNFIDSSGDVPVWVAFIIRQFIFPGYGANTGRIIILTGRIGMMGEPDASGSLPFDLDPAREMEFYDDLRDQLPEGASMQCPVKGGGNSPNYNYPSVWPVH